jgi:RNA polymerase-binding protein DksA
LQFSTPSQIRRKICRDQSRKIAERAASNSILREVRIMPTKAETKAQSKSLASSKVPGKATAKATVKTTVKATAAPAKGMDKKSLNGKAAVAKPLKKPAEVKQARPDLDIDHFRSLLLEERARLEGELEGLRSRSTDVEGSLPDEGESGDEDTADLAAAMMDKEIDLSVEDEVMDLLNAIDHALEKMEEGTYGICDISGEAIPKSRLELIPWASLTVACQAMSEGE